MLSSIPLQTILPGLTAGTYPGTTYGVRCWTYVNQGFASLSLSPTTSSAAYLGGRKVYGSGSVRAPVVTLLSGTQLSRSGGDVHQLLVVDWMSVAPSTPLRLLNSSVAVTISPAAMRLPIGGVAYSTSSPVPPRPNADVFNGTQAASSTAGTYARAAWAPSGDIAPLLLSDLGPAYAAMGAAAMACTADSSLGLAGTYAFPQLSRTGGQATFYSAVEGYLWPYVTGTLTFQVR